MTYTVPWLPAGREPRDGDELSGTSIMLACLAGDLVARQRRPVEREVLAAAMVGLFDAAIRLTDDGLVNLVSTSILLAHALGLIERTADDRAWRSTTTGRRS